MPNKNKLCTKKSNAISIKNKEIANSVIQVIAESIPFVGNVIAEGLSLNSNIKQARFMKFTELLKEYFEKKSNLKINEEFIGSEEFAQFFEMVIRRVVETKEEEKLNHFKAIVINKINIGEIHPLTESFLHLVSVLNSKQIEILAHYAKRPIEQGQILKQQQKDFDLLKELTDKLAEGTKQNRVKLKANLKIVEKRIETNKPLISEEIRKSNAEYYKYLTLENEVFIQDLLTKGLLSDITDARKFAGLRIIIISEMGLKLLDFIRNK